MSGFLATGSAGGSLLYGIEENLLAFRVIDGLGNPAWIERDHNPDLFYAVGVSMGLLGIISKVRLKLTRSFVIFGQEVTTPAEGNDCPIDLFGAGASGKPSLEQFLRAAPYSRLLWWPQHGSERIVTWQATPAPPPPSFSPVPYQEFGLAEVEELTGAIFFTLVGNLDDLHVVPEKLDKSFAQFSQAVDLLLARLGLGDPASDILAKLIAGTTGVLTDVLITILAPAIKAVLPRVFPTIINAFQPLTTPGKPTLFQDYAWRSLPMDNAADDILLGTAFTELWIPIAHTQQVMTLLKSHFATGFAATGYYSTELYAAKQSAFWLSPSYHEDVVRVDVFWYTNNAGDPTVQDGFYAQFWHLLRQHGIPFRLHWGKGLPEYDYADWAQFLHAQYPRWDDFMQLRQTRDPKNIFFTAYWQRHLLGQVVT